MNKLYNDAAVQAIANAIRAKNGSSDTYTIAEMSTALNDLSYYAKPTIENVPLATFEADGLPLNSLKASIKAKQASGTPSPSNPLPISGWDEANVSDVGKNLLPMSVDDIKAVNTNGTWSGNDYTYREMVYTVLTDSSNNVIGIKANGTSSAAYPNLYLPDMPIKAGTYTLSGVPIGSNFVIYFNSGAQIIDGATKTFNVESDYTQTGIRLCVTNKATADNIIFYPQIEVGDRATTYEPYQGNLYTITLPQTVYGGELDVVNGELKVTHGYIASYNGETLPSTWISSMDVYAEGTTPTTGAEVCYELATPTTVSITPSLIKSLNGTNNLSVDCGDVIELEYFKEV